MFTLRQEIANMNETVYKVLIAKLATSVLAKAIKEGGKTLRMGGMHAKCAI